MDNACRTNYGGRRRLPPDVGCTNFSRQRRQGRRSIYPEGRGTLLLLTFVLWLLLNNLANKLSSSSSSSSRMAVGRFYTSGVKISLVWSETTRDGENRNLIQCSSERTDNLFRTNSARNTVHLRSLSFVKLYHQLLSLFCRIFPTTATHHPNVVHRFTPMFVVKSTFPVYVKRQKLT